MDTREKFEAHIKETAWHQVLSGAAKDGDDGASVFRMAMMAASEAWTAAERQSAEGIETMAHRLQVANDCCERLMSACTDAGCPDRVNMADWIRKNATRATQANQEPVAWVDPVSLSQFSNELNGCKSIAIGLRRAEYVLDSDVPLFAAASQFVTRDAMQEKAIVCGFKYWRASDAHGVVGTIKQAEDLIADLVGVEVEIKG